MQVPQQAEAPEQVHATARESAFYQAGYEAGAAHHLQGKAAELGALALSLEAFQRTCVSLRTGLSQLHEQVLEPGKRHRALTAPLHQAAQLVETLRGSLLQAQQETQIKAKQASDDSNQARKTFAQQVTLAQQLQSSPSLLKRLAQALKGPR